MNQKLVTLESTSEANTPDEAPAKSQSESSTNTSDETDDGPEDELPAGLPAEFALTARCDQLTALTEAIAPIADEVVLEVTENHISACCVDPANVAMVDASLDVDAVESLTSHGFKFGLNVKKLEEALGAMSNDQAVTLTADDQKLRIESGALSFTRAQPDTEYVRTPPELPDFDHNIAVEIEQPFLARAKKATGLVDDQIQVKWDENTLNVGADGDTDTVTVEPRSDEANIIQASPNTESVRLASEYVSPVITTIPRTATTTLEVSENMPIEIEYTNDETGLTAYYMIAPRVDA